MSFCSVEPETVTKPGFNKTIFTVIFHKKSISAWSFTRVENPQNCISQNATFFPFSFFRRTENQFNIAHHINSSPTERVPSLDARWPLGGKLYAQGPHEAGVDGGGLNVADGWKRFCENESILVSLMRDVMSPRKLVIRSGDLCSLFGGILRVLSPSSTLHRHRANPVSLSFSVAT